MQHHASCAACGDDGVLLIGPPGAGKSDLLLRLLDNGFHLVADDRVEIEGGYAWPPPALAGLLEVRQFGIVRLPYIERVRLRLVVTLTKGDRLPEPIQQFGLPALHLDPARVSATTIVKLALRCIRGQTELVVGAFG